MRALRAAILQPPSLALLLLGGCAVGPKYAKPAVPVPAAYKEQRPQGAGPAWKEAQPADQTLRGDWWEIFNDSELNALEARVGVSNETLKIAEANFRQSRAVVRSARSDYYPTVTVGASNLRGHPSPNPGRRLL